MPTGAALNFLFSISETHCSVLVQTTLAKSKTCPGPGIETESRPRLWQGKTYSRPERY